MGFLWWKLQKPPRGETAAYDQKLGNGRRIGIVLPPCLYLDIKYLVCSCTQETLSHPPNSRRKGAGDTIVQADISIYHHNIKNLHTLRFQARFSFSCSCISLPPENEFAHSKQLTPQGKPGEYSLPWERETFTKWESFSSVMVTGLRCGRTFFFFADVVALWS